MSLRFWDRLTADFPREKTFGLRHSRRKTAVDIPANIAEGAGESADSEFARSINSALGLSTRLEYYTLVAVDVEMMNRSNHDRLNEEIVEVRKMLTGSSRKLA